MPSKRSIRSENYPWKKSWKKQMAFWRTAAASHGCRKIARFSSRAATKKVKPNKENFQTTTFSGPYISQKLPPNSTPKRGQLSGYSIRDKPPQIGCWKKSPPVFHAFTERLSLAPGNSSSLALETAAVFKGSKGFRVSLYHRGDHISLGSFMTSSLQSGFTPQLAMVAYRSW